MKKVKKIMNLHKYFYFAFIILIFGCDKDDEKVEIETEKIVNGRILLSANNQVPENLKVLSLDGITELGINTNLDLPSSSNELEFLLTDDNQLLFVRKKHPNLNDVKLSSESTVLFLCTYNSAYNKLDDSNKNTIVNQILNNPNFMSAKNILDNSTSINLSDENFKQKIQEIISQIYSVENLNLLSRTQMPLQELTTIYTAYDDILSIKNNADIHVGFSITKDGNPFDDGDGLLDGQEQKDFTITDVNAVYHIKSNSGADISGVFNDNDLEEINAFNADFRKFLFDSFIILAELAVPTINNDCFEPIYDSAIDGIDFAEEYGNNNVAPDVLVEAYLDIQPTIAELLSDGVQCVGVNSTILDQIFEVFNIINDIVSAANFLNDQLNVIDQYIQFENYEYDCYYKVETVFYECDNPTVGVPTGPVPVNNAENVPVNGTFSFNLGDNTPDYAAFKVYTGLNTNLINFTITNSTYNEYFNLQQGTTYYWKVEVINPATDQILSTSNTWSFTTSGTSDTIPSLSTNSITNITETSASSGGNIINDGGRNVTTRGICWSTNQNPTTNNNSTNNGTGTGTFTSSLSNLNPNTTYYVRAYATNNEGTAYGNQQTFTTDSNNNSIPTVTTNSITNITETSASSGGNVTNDGGNNVTARGICWSTSQNPTINNNITTNGTGTGNFTSTLSNLNSSITYYVRAYATNSVGTAYGNQKTFTTNSNNNSSEISINGNLNFGDVKVGQSNTRTFTIKNTGNKVFNVLSISFPSGVYSANWNSGTINANGSQNVIVTFQPTNVQSYNDIVTVNHNADSGNNTISISGNGTNNNQNVTLSYNDHLVKDGTGGGVGNSNGIAEAGEEIDLDVRLINIGNTTATNVSAVLTTNDPDINITDSSEAWADIPAGATEWEDDFDFDISANCPTKSVTFNLQITSDQGTWNDSFTINVQGSSGGNPQVDVGNNTPRDNCSDTGSSNNYKLDLNTIYYKQNWNINNIIGYGSDGNRGMWYRFETTNSGSYNIGVSFNGNAGFQLFSSCTSSSPIITSNGSSGNAETAQVNLNGNTEYYIRFYDINDNNPVNFVITIENN